MFYYFTTYYVQKRIKISLNDSRTDFQYPKYLLLYRDFTPNPRPISTSTYCFTISPTSHRVKQKKDFKFLRITRGMNFKYSKTCPRFIKTPPTAPNLSDVPLKKRKRKREANKRASSLNPSASILHFLSLYSFPRFLEQRRVTRKKASTAASGGGRREGGNG